MLKIKNPLIFIFITVLIDCIGVRIIYPVSASIISEVSHVNINESIIYSGWMIASYAIMQFVFSPILGGLSDRYGRRPILLFSLFGLGVDYFFLALANSLPFLFIGKIIAGICGSSISTSFAYVADISVPEKRAQNFGLIGAAVGLAFIIGPFLGGLLSEFGTRVPFIAAASLSLLNWLYGFFILPESLKSENKRAFRIKRSNPFTAFMQIKKNKSLRLLFVVLFLLLVSGQVMPSIWPFYTKYVYKWSDLEIGYSLAFVGMMLAIVKGGFIKWMQTRFGSIHTVYIGLVLNIIGLGLFAFSNQAWMVYAFALIYCLSGIAQPSLQGIISGKMGNNEQGELQSTITLLISLSNIISPFIMTHTYYYFTKENNSFDFPGAAFAAAALITCFSLFLFVKYYKLKFTIKQVENNYDHSIFNYESDL